MKMILTTLMSSVFTYICLNLLQIELTSHFIKKNILKAIHVLPQSKTYKLIC